MAELIVHLPGLERSPAHRLPESLAGALRRARRVHCGDRMPLSYLLGCDSIPGPAALSALDVESCKPSVDYWLRFDVVRLIPDLTAVWIDRPLAVDFGDAGYAELAGELGRLFEAEGFGDAFRFSGRFGLLGLHRRPDCRFRDIDEVQGGRLDECLPSGPGAARWRRLITASQILFHRFRALDRADQTGAGIWVWGGAEPASPLENDHDLRLADPFDSATARGLGRWLGAPVDRAGSLPDPIPADRMLVALPPEHPAPGEALDRLVSDWLEPALAALGRGALSRVSVVGSSGSWRLGRWSSLAFWRRRARGLAEASEA